MTIRPGKLTWNLQINQLAKENHVPSCIIVFHVNFPVCKTSTQKIKDTKKKHSACRDLKGKTSFNPARKASTCQIKYWTQVDWETILSFWGQIGIFAEAFAVSFWEGNENWM